MTSSSPVVLAIQNDPTDPPALTGEWLEELGIRVDIVRADLGEIVPSRVPEGVHGLLSLGGSMGANDDEHAPWLVAERELLADAVATGVPVLGLCLGGQLLAAAMGGRVTLGPTTEVGVVNVRRTLDGLRDPVISQVVPSAGSDIPAAQWHQDNIVQLPDEAVLLLTNDACPVQGFRVGDAAYGLQMHPEVDGPTYASWGVYLDEAGQRANDVTTAVAQFAAAERDLITAWRPMTRAWGELVWSRARMPVGDRASDGELTA